MSSIPLSEESGTVTLIRAIADELRTGAAGATSDFSELADRLGISLARSNSPGLLELTWTGTGRDGVRRPYRATLDPATGAIAADRVVSDWIAAPQRNSRIVVAPDMLTFWRIREAIGDCSIYPFLLVAPTSTRELPPEWGDKAYWRFEQVTILVDSVISPPPLLAVFAKMQGLDAAVAIAKGGVSWRDWASQQRLNYECIERLAGEAHDISDFRPLNARSAQVEHMRARRLDEQGRLCKVLLLRDGRGAMEEPRPLLVRSDGTFAPIAPEPRCRGPVANGVQSARAICGATWTFDSDGASTWEYDRPASGQSAAYRLVELAAPLFGGDVVAARVLVAFAALTHLYAACPQVPVLVVQGGSARQRLALRRLLAAICHAPTSVARTRAAQLARLADATDGVLLMEEPGPLVGPLGATEVGRFLEAACLRDLSAYNTVARNGGLRSLQIFGPKVVIARNASFAGLACEVISLDLADEAAWGDWPADEAEEGGDDLRRWAMCRFGDLRDRLLTGPARLVPILVRALLPDAQHDLQRRLQGKVPTRPQPVTPGDRLREILVRCGSGGHLAMIQVLLEIALLDDNFEAFTPERIGKWIASRIEIDPSRPSTRRRLYGQISRIYPLVSGVEAKHDPLSAFKFCIKTACESCRYMPVCDSTLPGMRQRKNSST